MQSNRPDAVRTTDRMESGRCRKIDRCNVFFIGAEPRVMNQEIDQAETEKKPKTFLVHRIEPGCSPIDRMQSGPPTGWSPEGVRKIDRCNVFFIGAEPRVMNQKSISRNREKNPKHSWFTGSNPSSPIDRRSDHRRDGVRKVSGKSIGAMFFHRGRTSSNEPGNRSSRNREKNPKHSWFTGSNPDAVQSTGCSPDHRPDGVRKVSGKSIGAMFFIGAEPRVMNQEIDQAETEKKPKTFLVHRIEPGCSPIDRMQSGPPTGWSPEGVENRSVQCFFHRGRTSSNEPGNGSSRNREKNPKHSWFTGSNPDAVQSTGCSPDHRPDGVRKVSGKSIGAMFFSSGPNLE